MFSSSKNNPVRLEKETSFTERLISRLEKWVQVHWFELTCLTVFLALLLFIVLSFVLVGATESGNYYNHMGDL